MTIEKITATKLPCGENETRQVKAGDLVELLPADEKPMTPAQHESLTNFLGEEGPYEISWIGKWPCGRKMLYFKIPGREPGAHASNFRYHKSNYPIPSQANPSPSPSNP